MNSAMPRENEAEPVSSQPIHMSMNAPRGHGRSHLMGLWRPTMRRYSRPATSLSSMAPRTKISVVGCATTTNVNSPMDARRHSVPSRSRQTNMSSPAASPMDCGEKLNCSQTLANAEMRNARR